jgi:hypothetical protein
VCWLTESVRGESCQPADSSQQLCPAAILMSGTAQGAAAPHVGLAHGGAVTVCQLLSLTSSCGSVICGVAASASASLCRPSRYCASSPQLNRKPAASSASTAVARERGGCLVRCAKQQAVCCRRCATYIPTSGRTWCLLGARACRVMFGECCGALCMDPLLQALIAPATWRAT